MLYRPLSLVVSVLGGILAGAVFKKMWALVSGEEEAPEALRELLSQVAPS